MYPVLFEIGNVSFQTYNVMLFLGIFFGFFLLYTNIKNLNSNTKNNIFLFAIIIFIPFILGAKIGYLFQKFLINKNLSLNFFDSSFSLTWGLIFATLFAFPSAKILNLNVWEAGDYFSISISTGGFFVRLGCFFNGCCFGIPAPSNFPFTVFFPNTSFAYQIFNDKPLYPVQLWLSLIWLFIFFILLFYKNKIKFSGELIILMFILFSFFNFFIEFFRFHYEKHSFLISQILNIIIFITSLIIYHIKSKN